MRQLPTTADNCQQLPKRRVFIVSEKTRKRMGVSFYAVYPANKDTPTLFKGSSNFAVWLINI